VYLPFPSRRCCECSALIAFSVETVHTGATCILANESSSVMIHRPHSSSGERNSWLTQEFQFIRCEISKSLMVYIEMLTITDHRLDHVLTSSMPRAMFVLWYLRPGRLQGASDPALTRCPVPCGGGELFACNPAVGEVARRSLSS
jgi:hypothetical protein